MKKNRIYLKRNGIYTLIITNQYVLDEIKEKAFGKHITILDRKEFNKDIYE